MIVHTILYVLLAVIAVIAAYGSSLPLDRSHGDQNAPASDRETITENRS